MLRSRLLSEIKQIEFTRPVMYNACCIVLAHTAPTEIRREPTDDATQYCVQYNKYTISTQSYHCTCIHVIQQQITGHNATSHNAPGNVHKSDKMPPVSKAPGNNLNTNINTASFNAHHLHRYSVSVSAGKPATQ